MKRHLRLQSALFLMVLSCAMLTFSGFAPNNAKAANCTTIQYGGFLKDAAYVIAEREGYFAREGVCVHFNQVTGSVMQFNNLLSGNYDIISTGTDNVANRVVNQNLPLSVISAEDKGPDLALAVNTANGIHSIADLRGKPIAVDAPDSGYVFALRKILESYGLYYEKGDYSFQIVGGALARLKVLEAGQTASGDPVYATLLIYPFTAEVTGPVTVLAKYSDIQAPFQNDVYATTQAYAASHGNDIKSFLRAFIQADRFVLDPANHDQVVADLQAAYNISPIVAEAEYNAAVNSVSGLNVDAQLDRTGLINVINLRTYYNGFNTPVNADAFIRPTKGGFNDDTYWREALHSLNVGSDDGSEG